MPFSFPNRAQLAPIGIGILGVIAFHVLDLPLPFLMGPIFACLIAALTGVKMQSIKWLNDSMRTILGVALGASLSGPILIGMLAYWPTLLLMLAQTAIIGGCGVIFFYRICRYDFATSYYSAMPGGLPDMVAFGEEAGANLRTLSLLHATRVLYIVVALPIVLNFYWQVDLSNPPGRPATDVGAVQITLMIIAAGGGWFIAKRIGMFGATILGPMILAGVFAVSGLITTRPPAEAIWLAQFFIGMLVGAKYAGITIAEIRRDILTGSGYALLLLFVTLCFLALIRVLDLAPPQDALMAFTPGGQAELVVLSIIIGANLPFVMAHHLLRLSAVIIFAPLVARWVGAKPKG